jgi:hypothetical protein
VSRRFATTALLGGLLTAVAGCGAAGCGANFYEDPERDDRVQWGQTALPAAPCAGDGDGLITLDEFMVDPGVGITAWYTANRGGSEVVLDDPAGVDVEGTWTWDLTASDPERDELLDIAPASLAGHWFEDRFDADGDAFATVLDGSSGMMGVYRLDAEGEALLLLGIASAVEGDVLVYDPPVPMLTFPLADGDAWTPDDAAAEGEVDGAVYPQDLGPDGEVTLVHTYAMEVDGEGVLRTHLGDLPVLRVRVSHRQEAYNSLAGLFAADSSRATLFVSECLGVVGRLRTPPHEVEPDFDVASEVLRLGYAPEVMP